MTKYSLWFTIFAFYIVVPSTGISETLPHEVRDPSGHFRYYFKAFYADHDQVGQFVASTVTSACGATSYEYRMADSFPGKTTAIYTDKEEKLLGFLPRVTPASTIERIANSSEMGTPVDTDFESCISAHFEIFSHAVGQPASTFEIVAWSAVAAAATYALAAAITCPLFGFERAYCILCPLCSRYRPAAWVPPV